MAFTSSAFLLFFALVLLVYFTVPKRAQWCILLIASYLFYFSAGWKYLFFILFTTLVSYSVARLLQRSLAKEDAYITAHKEDMEKAERKALRAKGKKRRFYCLLIPGLVLGIGMLAVLKYTGFVMDTVKSLSKASFSIPSLLLPLGISFYTFQSMGYLIDVYRKKSQAERNFFRYALFVSFFPQLLQGPISRYNDLSSELFRPHSFERNAFFCGFCRVLWGYFKKMVVADTAMLAVRTLCGDGYDGAYVFLLILLYSAQIYGDFTGGIDITIGLSEMMGIRLAENFNRPFASTSVKEYWRRWHITMGSWFSDYVFYPLSVCVPMQRFSKWSRTHLGEAIGKRLPVYIATIVTWFLTGFWHGAGMNFIVWGLLNCLVILASQELQPLWTRFARAFPRLVASRPWILWQRTRTFLLMGLIRSLDCYRDVGKTFRLWGSMLMRGNWSLLWSDRMLSFGLSLAQWCVLLAGILIICVASSLGKDEPVRRRLVKHPVLLGFVLCIGILTVLIFGTYGIEFDASDFIYTQF